MPEPQHHPTTDEGSATVEYAVVTLAVAALAAVLYAVLTGDQVFTWLMNVLMRALTVPS